MLVKAGMHLVVSHRLDQLVVLVGCQDLGEEPEPLQGSAFPQLLTVIC
jgi:hypothetical protein